MVKEYLDGPAKKPEPQGTVAGQHEAVPHAPVGKEPEESVGKFQCHKNSPGVSEP